MRRKTPFTTSCGLGKVHAIVAELAGARAADRMFTAQDLPLGLIKARNTKLPQQDVLGLHENAARAAGDELFGLRIGQKMQPEDFGTFARYALQAPDLATMLTRFERGLRYHQTGATFQSAQQGGLVHWSYRLNEPCRIGRRHHANHIIMPMLEAARRFAGEAWHPLWIELEADPGPWARGIEDILRAPARFGCPANSLVFDQAILRRPNRKVPPLEQQFTIYDLRRLVTEEPPRTAVDQTQAVIRLRLMNREADIEGAAAKMRMGTRTLQRALAAEGTSYRAIADAVRYQQAIELLAEGTNSVTGIAAALGYSDDSHFIRAFQRWDGQTPKAASSVSSSTMLPRV